MTEQEETDALNKHIKSWLVRLQYHIEAEQLDVSSVNYTRECRLIAVRLSEAIAVEIGKPDSRDLIYEIFKEAMGLTPKGSIEKYLRSLEVKTEHQKEVNMDTDSQRRDFERSVYKQYYENEYSYEHEYINELLITCELCGGGMYREVVELMDDEHERWTCDQCGHSWVDPDRFIQDDITSR